MAVDQRSTSSRGSRSARMPAAADSTTYGSIREAPARPSQVSLPVSAHTAASSAGHGIDIAVAASACETSSRVPGCAMVDGRITRSTVGSGANPLKPTVE